MAPRETFTIGLVCALQEEYEAACTMLDEELDDPEFVERGDDNTYCFGRIGRLRVVIGTLPSGRYGISSATCVAKDMMRTFHYLRFVLMVGIGGGAPTSEHDIRLGDVVVSVPNQSIGGGCSMKRRHEYPAQYGGVDEHLKRFDNDPRFRRPKLDQLFRSDSKHLGGKTCTGCDLNGLVARQPRTLPRAIDVFYGTIASSNSVIKDPKQRDSYAHDPEGICDYCDLHKNDDWHYYGAATAAAYARELLSVIEV
ncbi:nucleoside phosphorylase domain-containing protein [Trichoderma barbatum]